MINVGFFVDFNDFYLSKEFNKLCEMVSNHCHAKINLTNKSSDLFNCDLAVCFSKHHSKKIDNLYNAYLIYKEDGYDKEIKKKKYADYLYYLIIKYVDEFVSRHQEYFDSKNLLDKYENDRDRDFVVFKGDRKVFVSAPHHVSQYYKGIYKVREYSTGNLAYNVYEKNNCYCIIKTRNIGSIANDDNANRERKCAYKDSVAKIVKEEGVIAFIDIHTMKYTRKQEINLGIDGGKNLFYNKRVIEDIFNIVSSYGFTPSVDKPFKGKYPAMAGYARKALNIPSIQMEINSKFINPTFKECKYDELLEMISDIVNYFSR